MNLYTKYQKIGNRGSIKWILTVIIGIIVLSYFFDFNIQEAVEDEQTQSNLAYIREQIITFYNTYLKETINYLWNDIFIDLIWENVTADLQAAKNGDATSIEQAGSRSAQILQQ